MHIIVVPTSQSCQEKLIRKSTLTCLALHLAHSVHPTSSNEYATWWGKSCKLLDCQWKWSLSDTALKTRVLYIVNSG